MGMGRSICRENLDGYGDLASEILSLGDGGRYLDVSLE